MNYGLASIPVDLPLWMKVTASVGILTPLMTYIFIPGVSKVMTNWLLPGED
ncbi:antibiotic biosynthesis monooxygenase (ABM) superfamily enzyme [Arthrobacter bambusae]|nr:antibiotic biosynthesis monooxygenase (ABM) superfamily enzyme [Arthrobacter bambusae]MDQ0237292.1 antibiotic biosynthesis monooxygenase (ABM) superfamily enzyme [Arthrobacter bambusae]